MIASKKSSKWISSNYKELAYVVLLRFQERTRIKILFERTGPWPVLTYAVRVLE